MNNPGEIPETPVLDHNFNIIAERSPIEVQTPYPYPNIIREAHYVANE